MLAHVRGPLTHANVIASLALFVALGGTGYAALRLPRNSVGPGANVRALAVGASALRSGAVWSRAIHDRSIGVVDISASARASLRASQGRPARGPRPSGSQVTGGVNSGGGLVRGNAVNAGHQGGITPTRLWLRRYSSRAETWSIRPWTTA